MLKFGIYDLSQCDHTKLYGPFSSRKYVALDLYDRLTGAAPDIDKFQEHVIGRVATANGSFKKTHTHRFDEFDALGRKTLERNFTPGSKVKVHDIAVSDGRTTLPFFEILDGLYGRVLDYTASDYASHFKVIQRDGETNRIVLDSEGTLIQIVYKPFVFNMVCPENKAVYPLNHLMRIKARQFADRLMRDQANNVEGVVERPLVLVCRACKELEERDDRFTFRQFDIVQERMEGCDVIRAMNILNTSYFDDSTMRLITANLDASLNDGGFLITGSNMEEGTQLHGGIYRKTGDGFKLLESSGNGSPVHDIITGH